MRAGWRLWRGGGSLATLVGLSLAFAAILWLNRSQQDAMEPPPPAAVTIRPAADTHLGFAGGRAPTRRADHEWLRGSRYLLGVWTSPRQP